MIELESLHLLEPFFRLDLRTSVGRVGLRDIGFGEGGIVRLMKRPADAQRN